MGLSGLKPASVLRLFLASFVLALTAPLAASDTQDIPRGDMPDWLVSQEAPQASKQMIAESSNGITWLLLDWQIRATEGGYDSFSRYVVRVSDRSGLEEAGEVQIEFDPHDQQPMLNYVHVIRDGKVIDHTRDLELRLAQREDELDDGLLNGIVTAIGNIADVRVGDIVDYGISLRVTDTLWPGHYFSTLSTRWSEPVALRTVRISWPTKRPVMFRSINTDAAFSSHSDGDRTIYELIQRETPAQDSEDDVPGWYPDYGEITMSTMTSWQEVAGWAAGIYEGDESLPDDFAARIDAIAADWKDPADRLTEATRLVQDTIRYVGVEIAEGSFVPRRPREVVKLGYGDCKDKSLLLVVALRRLGIEAVPVLAATDWGNGLAERAPSPTSFNHVVVRAQLAGKPIWIDPTLSHQGGRGNAMTTPDYGYVLPIRAGQKELERIVLNPPEKERQYVVERYEIDEEADPAMGLTVETVYRYASADWFRERIAVKPASEIAKENLDYYLTSYPGIVETEPLAVEDDRDANVMRMVETYALSKPDFEKAELLKAFPVKAYAIRGMLPGKQSTPRRNPVEVSAFERRTQVIELNANGRMLGRVADIDETVEGINFKRTTVVDGKVQKITFALNTANAVIPAEKAGLIYDIADKLSEESTIQYNISRSRKSFATQFGVDESDVAPFEQRLLEVGELLSKKDSASRLKALTLLNAMSKEVDRPSTMAGVIDGFNGAALASAERFPAAQSALESMLPQYQGNYDLILALARLQMYDRKPVAAAQSLVVAQEHHPGKLKELDEGFVRGLMQMLNSEDSEERTTASGDLAIALAKAGWQQSPMSAYGDAMRMRAVKDLLERKRDDEARALYDAAPATAATAASLAADARYKLLWPNLADAVRDRFRTMIADDVKRSGQQAKDAPADLRLLMLHAANLRHAGRFADAAEAIRDVVSDHGRMEAAGEDGAWLVNAYADALKDQGRGEDALAEFDWLLELGVDRNPFLVSQAINRAELLNSMGRHEEALKAFTSLEGGGDKSASVYGRMWIWSGKLCAAQQLGNDDLAAEAMAKMEEQAKRNSAAMTMALACIGDLDRLEAKLLERLDDPDQRNAALGAFATTSAKKETAFDRRIRETIEQVLARPSLQEKLKEYGRALQIDGWKTYWGSF